MAELVFFTGTMDCGKSTLARVLVGLQRRVTGGVLAPIITHLVWSLGRLLLLPPLLAWAG